MTDQRLDRHGNPLARALFESDTAQVGSLGDIVEDHDGDSLDLLSERSVGGADSGESDLVAEMYSDDASEEWDDADSQNVIPRDEDVDSIGETDLTGTAEGIARGFGSHLVQDLGKDGFQIEEIPTAVVPLIHRPGVSEELDDYDDEDSTNGKFDSRELEHLSEPGSFPVKKASE